MVVCQLWKKKGKFRALYKDAINPNINSIVIFTNILTYEIIQKCKVVKFFHVVLAFDRNNWNNNMLACFVYSTHLAYPRRLYQIRNLY